VIPNRHGTAVIEFPNELEVLVTRKFDAPIQLVFDVFTKAEHMVKTIAPYGEDVKLCEIDLRVGGEYHYIFVSDDGMDMSFRGTFLEVEPPTRSVQTWIYDGWPDVEAVESLDLDETDGVTTMSYRLAFSDQAGRDHMKDFHGLLANFDNVEDLLTSLQHPEG
jgi:uncharacterized protein YndB with AHSA1/START domain